MPDVPNWVKDAVFYQIFPDRYSRSKRSVKPKNLLPWDAEPHPQKYHGGDLYGVVDRLDHIQTLGANAIYLTPIFQSACNHRYHTSDYFRVDPLLGGDKALRELISELHRRDMKIVLDGVFNHCSRGFFQFNDILENGPHSPWIDWFKIEGWPLAPYNGKKPAGYVGWRENRALPEFNTDNPQVREYIMQIAEYWIREFEIDGWRLDVAGEIETPGFWQEFRQRVRAINPEAYIVSEIWTLSPEWLNGDQFDAHMNYPWTEAVVNFAGQEHINEKISEHPEFQPRRNMNGQDFVERMQVILNAYHWDTTCVSMNLLDSHDTARMISIVEGDSSSLELATLIQMTYPGAPSIYYGDEIGIRGTLDYDRQHDDRHARWPMPWDSSDWDQHRLRFFREIIAIRHANPALRRGAINFVYAEEQVVGYRRDLTGETSMLVVINAGGQPATIALDQAFGEKAEVVFGKAELASNTITISKRCGCVVRLSD